MALTVWAIDPDRIRRGQLAPSACTAVLRDADVGTFQVTASSDELAARMRGGWRVLIQDGRTVVSGPVTEIAPDLAEKTVTFTGVSDLVHVEDRIVYPDPGRAAEAQTADAYYKRKGPAETAIRDMIHANAGTGAIPERRVDGFTVTSSQGRGTVVSTNLRYKNLLEEARNLGRLGGVTFDAVQEQDSRIILRFRVPMDRARAVRFSDSNGGVTDGSYSLAAPTATTVLVAGQGVGTDRTILERHRATTWGRRIEMFKDQRDTDEQDQLEQSATDQLDDGQAGATASFTVTETPGLVYGDDYQLGDTVTAQLGTAVITEPVRAVELTWDGHGRTAALTLGDHDQADDKTPAWVKHVKKLDARVRGLETT